MIICAPEQIRPLSEYAIATFEQALDTLYDPIDAGRGYLEKCRPARRGAAGLTRVGVDRLRAVHRRTATEPPGRLRGRLGDEDGGEIAARLVRGDRPPDGHPRLDCDRRLRAVPDTTFTSAVAAWKTTYVPTMRWRDSGENPNRR